MMTERERLAELILDANAQPPGESWPETLADYLLEHGVIVPPCKVRDTVWMVRNLQIERWKVVGIEKTAKDMKIAIKYSKTCCAPISINTCHIGEIIFLSREEAEAALAERRKS